MEGLKCSNINKAGAGEVALFWIKLSGQERNMVIGEFCICPKRLDAFFA